MKTEDVMAGEMTAFLTLIFILLVSFIGSVMESASIQMAKNYHRTNMNRAIESVFAEYQRELLQEFDVFGLDGSYESGAFSEEKVTSRISYYGAAGAEHQIIGLQLLTDQGGQPFREAVLRYAEHRYGADWLGKLNESLSILENQNENSEELEGYVRTQEMSLNQFLSEYGTELPAENNPLPNIKDLLSRPLLELVMPKGMELSEGEIHLEETLSGREVQVGYGDFTEYKKEDSLSSAAFSQYLLEHFDSVVQKESYEVTEKEGLDYELEYIVAGKNSDKENLNKVIQKLLAVRMIANYTYLLSDVQKSKEAEALALTLCTLALVPESAGVVKQVLLLGWAFGEALVDIRSLLSNKKIPLVKSAETWQLSLASLMSLGTADDMMVSEDQENGLAYQEYLRVFLILADKSERENVTMRSLDMIEQRFAKQHGMEWFQADACICKLQVESTCHLRRGISYQFQTYFGYR